MAKDKSKKSTKAADEFAKPSEAKGGGEDSWSLTDGDKPKSGQNDGELFLITPLRKQIASVTRGKKTEDVEVIVADIVHLNSKKPAKSEEHEEVFVWAKWVQGSLRSNIGEARVLGRLVKTPDSGSAVGYVWKLEDADDDDVETAREYLSSVVASAFGGGKSKGKVKSKADDDDDDEPAKKKGKKSKPEPEPEPAKKSKKSKAEPEPEPAKKKKSKK